MPNSSPRPRRVAWSSKADVNDQLRERWRRVDSRTDWVHCGLEWDAVGVHPMDRGLAALDRLGLGLRTGYPVLADHLNFRLYVMVPVGAGSACADVPGVRVLSRGAQLLVLVSGAGTIAAHWVSAPRSSRLVDAGRLAAALLATAVNGERVVAS